MSSVVVLLKSPVSSAVDLVESLNFVKHHTHDDHATKRSSFQQNEKRLSSRHVVVFQLLMNIA